MGQRDRLVNQMVRLSDVDATAGEAEYFLTARFLAHFAAAVLAVEVWS